VSDLVLDISIPKFLEEWDCNPFDHSVWEELECPITREEIADSIARGFPFGEDLYERDREQHIDRIAYFVVHGWTDPIEMDLGCPSFGYLPPWPVQDGNHRFAAAVYRGDTSIRASLGGEVKWIRRFRAEGSSKLPAPA
jgi:hypothetical protein